MSKVIKFILIFNGVCLFMLVKPISVSAKPLFYPTFTKGLQAYIDSAYNVYKSPNASGRLRAAMTLWSSTNHAYFPVDSVNLQGKDTSGLTAFIHQEVRGSMNDSIRTEWRMLLNRKRYLLKSPVAFQIDTSGLHQVHKAVFLLNTVGNLDELRRSGYNQIENLVKCYAIAKSFDYLDFLALECLWKMAEYQFLHDHLDSAIRCYELALPLVQKKNRAKFRYIPGYGVGFLRDDRQAFFMLNLGMCMEKKGNIVGALNLYQKGYELYDSLQFYPGIWWANGQMVNSYLDLGNYPRAQKIFLRQETSVVKFYKKIEFDNEYIWGPLLEFDYYDMYHTRFFLDSFFTANWKNLGPPRLNKDVNTESSFSFLMIQNQLLLRESMKLMVGKHPSQNTIFDTLDIINTYFMADHTVASDGRLNYVRGLELNRLCWKIGLRVGDRQQNVDQLFRLVDAQDSVYMFGRHFRSALIYFHSLGEYEILGQLIEGQLPVVEQGVNSTDQRKLYFQYANVLKHLAKHKKSLRYFEKSDSLKRITQKINHHEQLGMLDKKLEVEKERKNAAYLEKENLILEARRKRWAFTGLGLTTVLLLAIALFVISKKRNNAEKERQLAEMQLLKIGNKQKEHSLNKTTFELVKSNSSFTQLLQNIEQLAAEMNIETKKKTRSILLEYKAQMQDETWQRFNLQFKNTNAKFYQKLKEQIKGITESELRIAAMHVSGLTNKEISAITGQQISSLHTHKSRLRKKLGVENDQKMKELLESIQSS